MQHGDEHLINPDRAALREHRRTEDVTLHRGASLWQVVDLHATSSEAELRMGTVIAQINRTGAEHAC